jgi:acyl-CoA synthetase (AMP-forming)/AMP-acid ligase II
MKTLLESLRQHALEKPNAIAFEWLEGDNPEPVRQLSYHELDRQAHAVAQALLAKNLTGERVLLPFPPGLDFIVAFVGCLYTAAIPVPVPFPQNRRTTTRAVAILRDCQPALCLTTDAWAGSLRERLASQTEVSPSPVCLALEELSTHVGTLPLPTVAPEQLAYLQYTSGTGGHAKGVMVSHTNLAHNIAAHQAAVYQPPGVPMLSWLPQYHDMQLVGILARTLMIGGRCILMSPVDFLQRPVRWLRAISRNGAYISGGPNFAFEHCLGRIAEADRDGLNLSGWKIAFNSSERIRRETVSRFEQTFAGSGFNASAWYPAYGLAESTALVTGVGVGNGVQFQDHASSKTAIASCGRPALDCTVEIVDPANGELVAVGEIGEICVASGSNTRGYWNRAETSSALFYQSLAGSTSPGPLLRTGDLGFVGANGELYVTGRIKDLLIIRGINHHPEDIEASIDGCHPSLRSGELAVFSIDDEHLQREQLVVVAELDRTHRHNPDSAAIAEAVQIAINRAHELVLDHLILLRPGELPKTTSGKIQRTVSRGNYLANKFDPVAVWRRHTPPPATTPSA